MLKLNNLTTTINQEKILNKVNLKVDNNKIHVIMGPNGSGKSTLGYSIMGHPKYNLENGEIIYKGQNIADLPVDERARKGIFMAFQYSEEVQGVTINEFLKRILQKKEDLNQLEAHKKIVKESQEFSFEKPDIQRYLNMGFSGGEKKRSELLQASLLNPDLLILDEPDSGVDVDSLNLISKKIKEFHNNGTATILITHYGKIFKHLDPESLKVHIIKNGQFVMEGESDLIKKIENKGFEKVFEECGCDE